MATTMPDNPSDLLNLSLLIPPLPLKQSALPPILRPFSLSLRSYFSRKKQTLNLNPYIFRNQNQYSRRTKKSINKTSSLSPNLTLEYAIGDSFEKAFEEGRIMGASQIRRKGSDIMDSSDSVGSNSPWQP
ncbi:hypothetical protein Bca52824_072958 [Brassica carinata]|uniref:Uncharacterized protein n=1 Tax=Brassica carinata TaxID=52824 RepID=A0A8X7Q908_BRACI|nr:hypothetical protein Bca52824_072958 [Brassica carinata]